MVTNEPIWIADWAKRLTKHLRQKGFETIADFLKVYPAEPYMEVAKRIGPWVAAMQLERLQMQEAKRHGTIRAAAMDAFVRELNGRLPEGWIPDSATQSRAAGAYAGATSLVKIDGESPEFRDRMFEMYKALKELSPPIGWKPIGINDPLIEQAFARGWPEDRLS